VTALLPASTLPAVPCRGGCGQLLTDPDSRAVGMGPDCAAQHGIWHPRNQTIARPAAVWQDGPNLLDLIGDQMTDTDTDTGVQTETLYENPWLSLRIARAPERGINGYVYSHEARCQGRIVAVLPHRVHNGRRQYLVRVEVTPCWGLDPQQSAITGAYEGGDIEDDAVRELAEEAGYHITRADLIRLGESWASKSADTVYSLFSADLTGKTPGEAAGDGSRLEAEGATVWLDEDAVFGVRDPQVGLMAARLREILPVLTCEGTRPAPAESNADGSAAPSANPSSPKGGSGELGGLEVADAIAELRSIGHHTTADLIERIWDERTTLAAELTQVGVIKDRMTLVVDAAVDLIEASDRDASPDATVDDERALASARQQFDATVRAYTDNLRTLPRRSAESERDSLVRRLAIRFEETERLRAEVAAMQPICQAADEWVRLGVCTVGPTARISDERAYAAAGDRLEDAVRAYPTAGPCPTCSPPVRETVGLVCQTCGTDYGQRATERPDL